MTPSNRAREASTTSAEAPKGRVPTTSGRRTGWLRRAAVEPAPPAGRLSADASEGADGDAAAADKPPYGGLAVFIALVAGMILSVVGFAIAQGVTSYAFGFPAGTGAAVGQASAQVVAGQPLAVSVPAPLWLTVLTQLPLWFGLAAIPLWFAVKKGGEWWPTSACA